MATPEIIGSADLITQSWRNFIRNSRLYLQFAAWAALLASVTWAIETLLSSAVSNELTASLITMILLLPMPFLLNIIFLGMVDATAKGLQRKGAQIGGSLAAGAHRLIPFIWISILTFVVIALGPFLAGLFVLLAVKLPDARWAGLVTYGLIAPLAAALALVPPAIFSVRYIFTTAALMTDGKRGRDALRASSAAVAGRWWDVLLRIAVPGLLFGLMASFASAVALLLLGSVLGDPGMLLTSVNEAEGYRLLAVSVVRTTVYTLAAPLYIGANLTLWFDLKRRQT
jgi:hypothetical protein